MTGDDDRPVSVVFAFKCDDARGSEPGAGAALASAAASLSRVIVVTEGLATPAQDEALRMRVGAAEVVALRPHEWERRLPLYLIYGVWSLRARAWAARERRTRTFDVLHHATYASDWFLNPLTFLRKHPGETWVLGPVGGATYPPLELVRTVMRGGLAQERARRALTRVVRQLCVRPLAGRVDHALVLNGDSQEALRALGFASVEIASNAVMGAEVAAHRVPERERTVLFLGRGVAWKGLPLVLAAARHLPADVVLHVAGEETDTLAYREQAAAAACPVEFHGRLPRAEALALLARSGVLAFPSLHDSSGWTAGEAAALGVPTVCLPLGGVSYMAGQAAVTVPLDGEEPLDVRLARTLTEAIDLSPPAESRFTREAMVEALGRAYGVRVPRP